MKIPKKKNIYGKTWVTQYKWNLRDEKDQPVDGLCDKEHRIILLDRAMSKEDKFRTYLHELVHAVCYELKVDFTSVSYDVLEIVAEGLADWLFDNTNIRFK